MLHSQGEVSTFPSTPTVLHTPAPTVLWSDKPIRSTNYFRSKRECGLGMRCQMEAEPKRAEET